MWTYIVAMLAGCSALVGWLILSEWINRRGLERYRRELAESRQAERASPGPDPLPARDESKRQRACWLSIVVVLCNV